MKVFTAPENFQPLDKKQLTVFLAGSIEQDKAKKWQNKVIRWLAPTPVQILNPRRKEWDAGWECRASNPNFNEQVMWELNAMEHADIIIMYFDPSTMSPITLLELGLYADSHKLHVCCPDGFWRKGNVEIICRENTIPMYETVELLATMIGVLSQTKRMIDKTVKDAKVSVSKHLQS